MWTPDGQRVVFRSTRGGADSIVWQRADGTGDAETLVPNSNGQLIPKAVSPDGSTLAFLYNNDLRQLSLKGRQGVTSLVATRFSENSADFSPDGKWIAYQSDESGRNEVYVRPFPDVDHGKWQVSTAGGSRPLWARGGGELFFLDPEGALMAASVRTTPVFAAEVPRRLVESGYYVGPGRPFDVSPDGERFLMIKEGDTGETAGPPQIIVVEHFDEELRRLAPAK